MKVDHRSYRRNFCSREKKAEPNSGLYRIRTLDLCDTGGALLPRELTSQLGAGRWLVSSIGKSAAPVSQRSRPRFESRTSLNVFQAFFSELSKFCL